MFQFLIGTFKTLSNCIKKGIIYNVSIPHRYVQNIGVVDIEVIEAAMFQFLIGTFKT